MDTFELAASDLCDKILVLPDEVERLEAAKTVSVTLTQFAAYQAAQAGTAADSTVLFGAAHMIEECLDQLIKEIRRLGHLNGYSNPMPPCDQTDNGRGHADQKITLVSSRSNTQEQDNEVAD